MSVLDQVVENYLQTRRAVGFKLVRHGRLLPALARFLDQAGAATLTTELALAWASLPAEHPEECAHRLSIARGFAQYLQTLDANTEVPPADLLPRQRRRVSPYLYSDADVVALSTGEALQARNRRQLHECSVWFCSYRPQLFQTLAETAGLSQSHPHRYREPHARQIKRASDSLVITTSVW